MEAMRLNAVIGQGGELRLSGLPLPVGLRVELILLVEPKRGVAEPKAEYNAWARMAADQFLDGYDQADAIYDQSCDFQSRALR